MNITFHESLYRKEQAMRRLEEASLTICGAGALGANLLDSLTRCGVRRVTVIDRDRVEEHNLSTQPYELDDVGALKAHTVARYAYRTVGAEVDGVARELTEKNAAKLIGRPDLVLDCFDNSTARRAVTEYCRDEGTPCLHLGLADGFAEILWNEQYRVPSPAADDICDYPLARNLVTMTVAVGCEIAIRFLAGGRRENWSITLRDLSILPLPM